MYKAIVNGATGLIGRAVARFLLANDIRVLGIGRRCLKPVEIENLFGQRIAYLALPMKNIDELSARILDIGWQPGDDCVFFHFAWSGVERLTDGTLQTQMNNAVYAANAVRAAKQVRCKKFVNAGTLEETQVEICCDTQARFESSQTDYALSKLASRDMCKIVAYLEKIDYIHTRLSAPLDLTLSAGGYIASTLQKIASGQSYQSPNNKRLIDIVAMQDVAKAYYLIGLHGKNNANYYIGTGKPATLNEYFYKFWKSLSGAGIEDIDSLEQLESNIFDIASLHNDTGYTPSTKVLELIQLSER